jgi:chaperonin GroEL
MPHKHLLFRSEAREKVLRGATAIADALRVTLGPRSKCVLIEKKWGKPIVCNDGVTIAKEFDLKDPDENLGAQMLRGAAERTGDAVGGVPRILWTPFRRVLWAASNCSGLTPAR